MKQQNDSYSCGVFALINALRCFGVKVSEKIVRAHAATTEAHGTQEHGIKNALERFGWGWSDLSYGQEGEAWKALSECIESGSPVILSLKRGQHWAVAVGMLGSNRVIVHDSSNDLSVLEENGAFVYTRRQLFTRWTPAPSTEKKFYGIAVRKITKK